MSCPCCFVRLEGRRFLLGAGYLTHHPSRSKHLITTERLTPAFLQIYHALVVSKDSLQADIMQLPLTNDNMQWRKTRT